jgi:serine phosphatase RsbU (regulator of sigma subunit)
MPDLGGGGHIWARSRPATYVGGDLYDVIALPDGSTLAYVADVSGKGAAAALLMAALSTQIRTAALQQREIDQLLVTVNHTFYNLASEEGFFATIAMVRFWAGDGCLQLVSAGHLPPIHVANGRGRNVPIKTGIALGATPEARYEKIEQQLTDGEALLFFSDGIVEAENTRQEHFGMDRVIRHVEETREGPPWGEGLLQAVDRWRDEAAINDDITLLEIWRDDRA